LKIKKALLKGLWPGKKNLKHSFFTLFRLVFNLTLKKRPFFFKIFLTAAAFFLWQPKSSGTKNNGFKKILGNKVKDGTFAVLRLSR